MNCLQVMVDRSSTTAWAGAGIDGNVSASTAADNIPPVVFMNFSLRT
jgi:hypothetical protein